MTICFAKYCHCQYESAQSLRLAYVDASVIHHTQGLLGDGTLILDCFLKEVQANVCTLVL